jgi:hypothetical protein
MPLVYFNALLPSLEKRMGPMMPTFLNLISGCVYFDGATTLSLTTLIAMTLSITTNKK